MNMPKLGMKCTLKLAKSLMMVIGQNVGSRNPLKNITSAMAASCLT